MDHTDEHEGEGPAHALELVTAGKLTTSDFVNTPFTMTNEFSVSVGDSNLAMFDTWSSQKQSDFVEKLVSEQPDRTVAHRVGDFVFVHHGINLTEADPELWLVISWADPDSQSAGFGVPGMYLTIEVGKADGTVETIQSQDFSSELADQNALRASLGLPRLPLPTKVRNDKPAVALPEVPE
jgi:hydrogenase maturation factor